MEYQNSSIWKRSLARSEDGRDVYRDRLRSVFESFRERIGFILGKIENDFPDLTVHNLSHVDELWNIASLLAGDKYPINPLEAFVLGGAFLLHDGALCFDAYEGGKAAIRETVVWKDSFFAEKNRNPAEKISEIEARADFSAVRYLHAKEAVNLVTRNWSALEDGNPKYLVLDDHIREHLGPLMGEIAASHHKNIDQIKSDFSAVFNSPGEFPSEWQVDRLKLACILRCADAIHIDNKRAPDFLHALRQRSGISKQHWQAQNWLGRPNTDPSCPKGETILVTSTRSFPASEHSAWWVAYDAISVADREIRASNALLEARGGSLACELKIKRVRGAGSPEETSHYIRTTGWVPCSASIHVSNVESLVQSLGGDKLYGEHRSVEVALRELLQNSRDAICSRREIESNYKGEIFISYDSIERMLVIEDDGVGMSERVLTGPLLNFGTSFWSSDLMCAEFPGLAASGFRSSGRFGIGFFSVFMAAQSLHVASKRYDGSYSSTIALSFPHGLTLRPVLTRAEIPGFNRSTRISLELLDDLGFPEGHPVIAGGLIVGSGKGGSLFEKVVTLGQYLSSLCASLDVCVSYSFEGSSFERIHEALPIEPTKYHEWLRKFTIADACESPALDAYIEANASRLRPIFEGARQIGLAAISTFSEDLNAALGRLTAGGFPDNVLANSDPRIIGYIETGPSTARRGTNVIDVDKPEIRSWVEEQFELIKQVKLDLGESFLVASNLASFHVDSRQFASLIVSNDQGARIVGFSELVDILHSMPIAIYKSAHGEFIENYCSFNEYPDAMLLRPLRAGWNSLKFDISGKPERDFSIIDFIQRTADEKKIKIRWEIIKDVRQMPYFGTVDVVVAYKEFQYTIVGAEKIH